MEIKLPSPNLLLEFGVLYETHLLTHTAVDSKISPKPIAKIVIDYVGTLDDALAVLDGYPFKSIVLYYVRPRSPRNQFEFALALQSIGRTRQDLDEITLMELIHSLI